MKFQRKEKEKKKKKKKFCNLAKKGSSILFLLFFDK